MLDNYHPIKHCKHNYISTYLKEDNKKNFTLQLLFYLNGLQMWGTAVEKLFQIIFNWFLSVFPTTCHKVYMQ